MYTMEYNYSTLKKNEIVPSPTQENLEGSFCEINYTWKDKY